MTAIACVAASATDVRSSKLDRLVSCSNARNRDEQRNAAPILQVTEQMRGVVAIGTNLRRHGPLPDWDALTR